MTCPFRTFLELTGGTFFCLQTLDPQCTDTKPVISGQPVVISPSTAMETLASLQPEGTSSSVDFSLLPPSSNVDVMSGGRLGTRSVTLGSGGFVTANNAQTDTRSAILGSGGYMHTGTPTDLPPGGNPLNYLHTGTSTDLSLAAHSLRSPVLPHTTSSQESVYICILCKRRFTSRAICNLHYKTAHNIEAM